MHKPYRLILLGLISLLTACNPGSSSQSPSETTTENITSIVDGTTSSTETPSATSTAPITEISAPPSDSSEEDSESIPGNEPLSDPDVSHLARSSVWPSEALNAYLTYAKNIEMPVFTSESDFHHGIVDDLYRGEFYHILTRVRFATNFDDYVHYLTSHYDFILVDVEEGDVHYLKSIYGDVRLHMYYEYTAGRHEVLFEFFDGKGDQYTGPVAKDNLAIINLKTREAIRSVANTRVKWEVRPATLTVYSQNSGFPVGNTNQAQLVDPLHIYAGQKATFAVSDRYVITSIKILAASGYADRTVNNGILSNGTMTYAVDFVTITPEGRPSTIDFSLPQVMNVGQVRWLNVQISFETK